MSLKTLLDLKKSLNLIEYLDDDDDGNDADDDDDDGKDDDADGNDDDDEKAMGVTGAVGGEGSQGETL